MSTAPTHNITPRQATGHVYEASAGGKTIEVGIEKGDAQDAREAAAQMLKVGVDRVRVRYVCTRSRGRG